MRPCRRRLRRSLRIIFLADIAAPINKQYIIAVIIGLIRVGFVAY